MEAYIPESVSSSSSLVVAAIFIACLTVWGYVQFSNSKKWAGLPPGPKPEWLLGNSRILMKEKGIGRLRILDEIGKQFGGIYTLYFGGKPSVIVTDHETIKRVLNEDVFTGRPFRFLIDVFFKRLGLGYTDGPSWKEHRQFASRTLRDCGAGKLSKAGMIVDEAADMIRELEAMQSHPVNPAEIMSHCIANILCGISYGKRFDHKDDQFRRLASLMSNEVKLIAKNTFVDFYPWLRFIPFLPFRSQFKLFAENQLMLDEFCQGLIDEHQSSFVEGEEPRDYIDAYLNEQARQKDNPNSTFTREQLQKSILTLFAAGVETSANTICWTLIYLMENPEIYRRLQKEVDAVIPDGGFPNFEVDRPNMPLLEATTMEVLRLACLISVPVRRTLEPVELKGFQLPANTVIFPCMYSVHYNPALFPDPFTFNPSRFLDADGKIKKPIPEGYMPFSFGKRNCYGEGLAKMELIIFLASLVKHFEFRTPPGKPITSSDSVLGIVNSPIPYEMIFAPRSGGRRFSIVGNGVRLWE